MKVEGFDGVHAVNTDPEVLAALNVRFGDGVNELWLSHQDRFPAIAIWLRDEFATLLFFETEREPGFRSLNSDADIEGEMGFCTESVQHTEIVPSEFVVSVEDAAAAAIEFLHSPALPKAIKWMAL